MKRLQTISIIGCGWLGLPLANYMIKQGWQVKGSTTNPKKLSKLGHQNIEPYLLKVTNNGLNISDSSIFESHIYYINIPPRRNLGEVINRYPLEIKYLIEPIPPQARVIFISSTGVYPDHNQIQREELEPSPTKESGKALLSAEKMIRSKFQNWIILRMAGLVGPNRDPGRWFSGKQNLPNGLNPINMIHLDDCLKLSYQIITTDTLQNELYNVCSDKHPTKNDFYIKQSEKMGVPLPQFNLEMGQHKIIDNQKLKADLNYEFIFSDPILF